MKLMSTNKFYHSHVAERSKPVSIICIVDVINELMPQAEKVIENTIEKTSRTMW